MSPVKIWKKKVRGRGDSEYKDLVVGMNLVCSRPGKNASIAKMNE